MDINSRTPESVFLEYLNDWLTVERMAEYYNIEAEKLSAIIDKGRTYNHQREYTNGN